MGYAAAGGSSNAAVRSYFEIVVFLPNEGDSSPVETARALTTALGVGRAEMGIDALTGAVEVRLSYDASLYAAAREYLIANHILHEIDRR